MLDHLEYDAESLADEYFRDVKANVPIKLPRDYFPDDDANRAPAQPLARARASADLELDQRDLSDARPTRSNAIGER